MSSPLPRRSFLGLFSLGLAALWTALGALLSGLVVLSPLARAQASRKVTLGSRSLFGNDFSAVRVPVLSGTGWRAKEEPRTFYVREQENGELLVVSGVCTHLGCTVRWAQAENEFQCPCHGGRFDATGGRIEGPPPRSLDVYPATDDGGDAVIQLG